MDDKETSLVKWTADDFISAELGIARDISRNLVKLFEDGNEIAFIARYRRHLTDNASPDDLRHAFDAFTTAKAVKMKAEKMMKRVENEVEDRYQKVNLKRLLSTTMDISEMDTLFEPFKKTKKGTLASRATDLGVDTICRKMLSGEFINFSQYVVPNKEELNSVHKIETQMLNYLSNDVHRMEQTQAFIQKVSEMNNFMGIKLRVTSTLTKKAKSMKKGDKEFHLIDHFKLYTDFNRDARSVKPYQVLALERASSKNIINWKVHIDADIERHHPAKHLKVNSSHFSFLQKIIRDSTNRFLIPSIERNVKRRLLNKAERSAIDYFAKNVRELLLTKPIKGRPVLAIDPGYANGCKCALVAANGELIDTGVFYLMKQSRKTKEDDSWTMNEQAERIVSNLVQKCDSSSLVIAVGNGTASRPTQCAIASLIKRNIFAPITVKFCVISECGASIYSATELAAKELPDIDINIRSAVSLARRVIDPISEYIKIAPKHLGVGSYQHSVNEKHLDEMLDVVVRECVSSVGVDVNVASAQLLQRVSGLNKKTAASIVKYRQENGKIRNREELKEISGIGPKSFEQCAGFLFIYVSDSQSSASEPSKKKRKIASSHPSNPLDSTPVHPESYHIAKNMMTQIGCDLSQIGTETVKQKLLSAEKEIRDRGSEWTLVWELLTRPVLTANPPALLSDVMKVDSLHVDQVLNGVVVNHVQFGVFIDIGVGCDALAHQSTLPPIPPPVNTPVRVRIRNLELERNRIGVVIID